MQGRSLDGPGGGRLVAVLLSLGAALLACLVVTSPAMAATVPGAPTGLVVTPGDGVVDLSWTAPASDGGSAITGYRVDVSTDGGAHWATIGTTGDASTTAHSSGVMNNVSYLVRIAAVNAVGTGPESAASAPFIPSPLPAPPTDVSGAVWPAPDGEVFVTWTPSPAPSGRTLASFFVQWSSNGGGSWSAPVPTGSAGAAFLVTQLPKGATYLFRVAAKTDGGVVGTYSVPSAPVLVPADPVIVPPTTPTNVVGIPDNTAVHLTWTASTASGGAQISFYTIEWSLDGVTWPGHLDSTGSASPSFTVTNLANGVAYRFRVQAHDNGGAVGDFSALSAPVVPGSAPGIPPGGPAPATSVTLTATPHAVTRGRKVTLSGTISPATNGVPVSLQVWRHGSWTTLRASIAQSGFRFRLKERKVGRLRYRVVAAATATTLASTSPVVKVRVRD